LIPWKHFVQKAVIILGTLTSLVAFAKYIL